MAEQIGDGRLLRRDVGCFAGVGVEVVEPGEPLGWRGTMI